MEAFTTHAGLAVPLMRNNIDTDQIIPTRFLARASEEGLGDGLFAEWRVNPDGSPNTGFILNREPWTKAEIIVAGADFGCGSSREAAPRALRQRGFRAVVAPSFGDIFYGNCFRNGIVPVKLPAADVESIAAQLGEPDAPGIVRVDLGAQVVTGPDGRTYPFETPALLRRMLFEGLDEIDLTLKHAAAIAAFRASDVAQRPWAYATKTVPT